MQHLPNRHCYWYDKRQPRRAVLMRVPDVPEPHQAIGISAGELDRFIRANGIAIGGYAVPKSALRARIAARRERPPWSPKVIEKMIARGVLVRGVHFFQLGGRWGRLIFKWDAIVALIEDARSG